MKNIKQRFFGITPLTDREVSLSLKYFTEHLLNLKQTMLYLGLDMEDVEIKVSKTDWQYLLREIQNDDRGKAIKFFKKSEDDGKVFELCGVKVSYE